MKHTILRVSGMGVLVTSMALGMGIISYNLIDVSHQLEVKSNELTHATKETENTITKYQVEVDNLHKQITDLENENSVLYKELKEYKLREFKLRQERQAYRIENFEITAYTAGYESTQKKKGDPAYGRTTSGTYVKQGRTIACPKDIPFGTKVNIIGVGRRVCEDRGGAIKAHKIDLYMDNLNDALKFGRRKLKVVIYN